ncbi:MAG: Ku protein [Myxococcota bacterium]
MPRTIWKGHISFGLVEIPVGLYPALRPDEISFTLLDKRDVSPVGYRKVNKTTGEEISNAEIAKGYEIEPDRFVLLEDEDFRRANVEATRTIDIMHFVEGGAIDPRLYDKPYYVAPQRRGSKAYALLRAALERSGKVGVAKLVMRSRQYLAAVMVRGPVIVIEILRYAHELRDARELDLPDTDLAALGVRDSELRMAERLIDDLTEDFDPTEYRDEYRADLLSLIHEKAEAGAMAEARPPPPEEVEVREPVDLMALLEKSLSSEADGERRAQGNGRRKAPAGRGGEKAAGARKARGKGKRTGAGKGSPTGGKGKRGDSEQRPSKER